MSSQLQIGSHTSIGVPHARSLLNSSRRHTSLPVKFARPIRPTSLNWTIRRFTQPSSTSKSRTPACDRRRYPTERPAAIELREQFERDDAAVPKPHWIFRRAGDNGVNIFMDARGAGAGRMTVAKNDRFGKRRDSLDLARVEACAKCLAPS